MSHIVNLRIHRGSPFLFPQKGKHSKTQFGNFIIDLWSRRIEAAPIIPLPLLSVSLFGRVYSEDADQPLDFCPGGN